VQVIAKYRNIKSYTPFGMAMEGRTYEGSKYRYGFNTQEKDDEPKRSGAREDHLRTKTTEQIYGEGNSTSAEFWQYDARLGRRWNVDPVKSAWESPYATNGNNPIYFNDPNGDFKKEWVAKAIAFVFGGTVEHNETEGSKGYGEYYISYKLKGGLSRKKGTSNSGLKIGSYSIYRLDGKAIRIILKKKLNVKTPTMFPRTIFDPYLNRPPYHGGGGGQGKPSWDIRQGKDKFKWGVSFEGNDINSNASKLKPGGKSFTPSNKGWDFGEFLTMRDNGRSSLMDKRNTGNGETLPTLAAPKINVDRDTQIQIEEQVEEEWGGGKRTLHLLRNIDIKESELDSIRKIHPAP